MSDEPEPPRRLEWPNVPPAFGDEPEEVLDPGGNWLPESGDAPPPSGSPAFESPAFHERRWAPQHGVLGRSDSALPGAFMFPEPEPPPEPEPDGEDSGEVGAAARPGRGGTLLRELVETILLAILVFLAVRASIQHYRVEGRSMDPTLEDGEFLLVNSLVYSEINIEKVGDWVPFWDPDEPDVRHIFHGPERGDIVILHPRQRGDRDLVKRIIGVPGDTIEIRDGAVYIDGRELIEPYITVPWRGDLAPRDIPGGMFFVMGDNRGNSQDSRSFGLVREDDIVGKAMASWWPKEKWGFFGSGDAELAPAR